MFAIFNYAFNAIMPLLLLISLGYFLHQIDYFPESFFKNINKYVFHIGFPVMMFINLYDLESIYEINLRLAIFVIIALLILTAIGMITAKFATTDYKKKGVLVQAVFRTNMAGIGIPLTECLVGAPGLMIISTMQAPTIIYFNMVTIILLSYYSGINHFSLKNTIKGIITNPIIIGLITGLIFLLVREFIPLNTDGERAFSLCNSIPWLYTTLKTLSRTVSPMALIGIGGMLNLSSVGKMKKYIIYGVGWSLIISPVLAFILAFFAHQIGFIEITPPVMAVLIAIFCTPLGTASAVMSEEMGFDSILASQIIVWGSVFCMPTIFIFSFVARALGVL